MFNSRFIDKQHKMKNLLNAHQKIEDKFKISYEKYIKLENLRTSLLKSRNRNMILDKLISEKRDNIRKLNDLKNENHDKNRSQRIILPKYEDKV